MKRPTWATVVGVLGIIFGCFGILGAGQEILMPKMMQMQKEVFTEMENTLTRQHANTDSDANNNSQENNNHAPAFPPEMFKSMQKMWDVPDWFGTWSMFTGIAKALISAFYLFASICLLQTNPLSIRLFYWAAGASISLCILKVIVLVPALSFMSMAMMLGGAFGALIDVVLIIVVATGNKEAFRSVHTQQVSTGPSDGDTNKKGSSILKPIILTLVAICIISFFAFVFIKVVGNVSHLFKEMQGFSGGQIYEVTKASKDLPVSREPRESIGINQFVELRKMLENKQYEELTATLEDYQNSFESDHATELKVYDAYRALHVYLPSYEPLLREWIEKFPERYPPYLVMAQYYKSRGWESRGAKWAKDTTEEQFDKMRMYFAKAEENANAALEINPNLFIAYDILLGICNADGLEAEEDSIIESALELFPHTLVLRGTYMWAKTPRWGGSYAIMEDFAKEAEKYSNKDSNLATLYGAIYNDQAKILKREDKYVEAVGLLAKALSFGDFWGSYYDRARIYHFDLNEQDKALEDINRSIVLRPTRIGIYLLRSKIYFAKEEMSKSLEDLRTAILLRPGDPKTLKWKMWASNNLVVKGHNIQGQDPQKAIEEYNLSIEFYAENATAWSNKGVALQSLQEYEESLKSFDKSINLKPDFAEAWDNKGITLVKLGKHEEAIKCHDKAIELKPNMSNAWYNKACTYSLIGDKEKCLATLQKAIELYPNFKEGAEKDDDFKNLWNDEDFKRIIN